MSNLRRQIKTYLGENKSLAHTVVGDGVSRAFLQAMVALIGSDHVLHYFCILTLIIYFIYIIMYL